MEGTRIKGVRLNLGLSQERFARHLGVSLQTVRRWESGLTKPLPIISLRLEELQREAQKQAQTKGGSTMTEAQRRRQGVIDLDIGFGLGGLFKGIGSLLDLVTEMAEEGKEEAARSGQAEAKGGKLKGVYGFSVRMGLGGKPIVEQFGNIQETEAGPVVAETQEPLVDVLDEGDRLVVIVELPGIEEKDIQLRVEGDMLEVSAATGDRKYQKEVLLPAAVAPDSQRSSYRNGVLEIRLAKQPLAG